MRNELERQGPGTAFISKCCGVVIDTGTLIERPESLASENGSRIHG